MIKIALLVCPQTVISSLAMAQDCFNVANQLAAQPLFQVYKVSVDGLNVHLKDMQLKMDGDLTLAENADLVLIPPIGANVKAVIESNPSLITWLAKHENKHLASLCSAAIVLAASGVLNGYKATTHWHLADHFRRYFPLVNLHRLYKTTTKKTLSSRLSIRSSLLALLAARTSNPNSKLRSKLTPS